MQRDSWHRHRGLWIALIVVLLVMVIGRLVAPSLIKKIINSKLENMEGGYQGSVEDVVIRMLDAEIGLRGMRIVKKNGLVPVPFMQMKELVLRTERESWRPRTVLRIIEPNAAFVDAESEARKQKGPPHQLDNLSKQLPFELLRVEVVNGQFHFRNFQTKPDIDVYAHDLNAVWDKLVGCLPPGSSACHSHLEASAVLLKSGKLDATGTFARTPEVDFHLDAKVNGLRVPQLNPVLAQYAKVDVKKGDADLTLRYDRNAQHHHVLLVPALTGFEVVGSDDKKTSFARELGVAAAAGYFERKAGKKAISIDSKPGHDTDFKLIDLPGKASDKANK